MADWPQLLLTIVGSGVGSAIVQALVVFYGDYRKGMSSAAYLAMRLAVTFEDFASACADTLSNIDVFRASRGAAGSSTLHFPVMPDFPSDDDAWRAMDQKVVNRVLSFSGKTASHQRNILFLLDVNDEEGVHSNFRENLVHLGLDALDLAKELRLKYGFAKHESNVHDFLKNAKLDVV